MNIYPFIINTINFLGSWLLQSSLLIIISWCLTLLLKRHIAKVRSNIWLVTFLLVISLPITSPIFSQITNFKGTLGENQSTYSPIVTEDNEEVADDFGARNSVATDEEITLHGPLEQGEIGRRSYLIQVGYLWRFLLFVAIALIMVKRNLVSYFGIYWSVKNLPEICIAETGETKVFTGKELSFVWGIFKPSIIVGGNFAKLSDIEKQMIISHELNHIKNQDSARILLLNIVKTFLWFNPLVHMASKQARLEMEVSCDESVIYAVHERESYAQLLVESMADAAGLEKKVGAIPAVISKAGIKSRIKQILSEKVRVNVSPMITIALVIVFLSGFSLANIIFPSESVLFASGADAEGPLSWLPAASFDEIIYYDMGEDTYLSKEMSFEFGLIPELEILRAADFPGPIEFFNDCSKFTAARYSRMTVDNSTEQENYGGRLSAINIDVKGSQMWLHGEESLAWVLEIEDLDNMFNEYLENGTFINTGFTYYRFGVYFYKNNNPNLNSDLTQLVKIDKNTLLLCTNRDLLKWMIGAGLGVQDRLFERKEFKELLAEEDRLGSFWNYSTSKSISMAIVNYLESNGAADEEIKEIRTSLSVKIIRSIFFEKPVRRLSYEIYADDEAARKAQQDYEGKMNGKYQNYFGSRYHTVKRDGNELTFELVLEGEALEFFREQYKFQRRGYEGTEWRQLRKQPIRIDQ